jgi:hypothetical protein
MKNKDDFISLVFYFVEIKKVLLGSQSFSMNERITQSLAGRVANLKLLPLSFTELQSANLHDTGLNSVIFKGFYPPIFYCLRDTKGNEVDCVTEQTGQPVFIETKMPKTCYPHISKTLPYFANCLLFRRPISLSLPTKRLFMIKCNFVISKT